MAILSASYKKEEEYFGNLVSISDETIVIGASRDNDVDYASGLAYIL